MRNTTRSLWMIAAGIGAMLPVLASAQSANGTGAVFVMTNAADKNEIIAYARDASGNLADGDRYETGGRGSGGLIAPLGSQGALTLSQDHTLLFAVNAGSGTVSVFKVENSRLFLIDEISAAGSEPVAVAQQGNLVYVLDAGGQGSVTGYRLQFDGTLKQIENSTAFLTPFDGGSGAGSLSISPNGRFLLVTERVANTVDAFPINADGTLGTEVTTASLAPQAFAGQFTPSGFAVVAQTNGSVSSYSLGANGAYTAISANVPNSGGPNLLDQSDSEREIPVHLEHGVREHLGVFDKCDRRINPDRQHRGLYFPGRHLQSRPCYQQRRKIPLHHRIRWRHRRLLDRSRRPADQYWRG